MPCFGCWRFQKGNEANKAMEVLNQEEKHNRYEGHLLRNDLPFEGEPTSQKNLTPSVRPLLLSDQFLDTSQENVVMLEAEKRLAP